MNGFPLTNVVFVLPPTTQVSLPLSSLTQQVTPDLVHQHVQRFPFDAQGRIVFSIRYWGWE